MKPCISQFLLHAGEEALQYNQFMRVHGIREIVNDINNPKIQNLGDIELPRNSLYHYLPSLPGEVGPGNETASFLYTQKGKINMLFDWAFQLAVDPGGVRKRPKDMSQIELRYFKTHFRFTRIRSLGPHLNKENELIVNNLAPAFLSQEYTKKTPAMGYFKYYNEMATVIDSINRIADISQRHQFWEIKLPNQFVTFENLRLSFNLSKNFFTPDGKIKRISLEAIKNFAANRSYWLLDLYGFLLGHENAQYSVFNRLSEKARSQCNFVFSYSGRCVIVNIQSLLNLMGYRDDKSVTETTPLRVNYFKRFYLNLISMTSNINAGTLLKKTIKPKPSEETVGTPSEPAAEKVVIQTDEVKEELVLRTPSITERENEDTGAVTTEEVAEMLTDPVEEDTDEESEVQWGDDIPDDVFDQVTVANITTVTPPDKYTPTTVIERALDQRAKEGRLTQREKEFFLSVANSYKTIDIDGRTVEEIIDIKPADMVIDDISIAKDADTIIDKSVLKSRTYVLNKGYVDKLMQRNIVEMLTYVQNGEICVTDIRKEPVTTATSKYDVWTIETQPLNGNKKTSSFRIPRIQNDGTFMINGESTYMQIQRMEKPVRKVSEIAVQLTSYYDKGRIRIERSKKVVDDYAHWLKLRIVQAGYKKDNISTVLGSSEYKGKNVCPYYSILAQRFKGLQIDDLVFNFDTESLWEKYPDSRQYCNAETWCVNVKNGNYLLIDKIGMVSWNGQEDLGFIEDLVGLETHKAPLPVATININGYRFPIVVVLSYWMGLNTVLKAINAEYRIIDPNIRPKLSSDEYLVTFADEKLIFNRRDELTTLVVSGLNKLPNIREFSRSHLDDPNIWFSLIDDPKVRPAHFREMSQIYDMFIDPITKRLLEKDGYSTSMDYLVIEATQLLLTRYAPDEVEITEQRFVGYERFAGHIYRELCKSTRQFKNKPAGGKRTFDINPDAIMLNIITDSSVPASETVNPMHQLKQQEEVTFGGTLGRAQQAMVKRTRGMQENYTGIISEAGKDSGKVGFVSFLTSDAKITDYYGNVDVNLETTKSGYGSVTMNTLYGGTRDDAKRQLFAGVQRSQLMATVNYTTNPIRTSYDTIIAQRTNEIYSSVAKKNGTITSVDEKYGIRVEYEDGTTDRFPLGTIIGKGAGEYHKHTKITDMKVGDKFNQYDVLAFDDLFFKRDPFNKGKVVVAMSLLARIALIEDQTTFEDSAAITSDFAQLSAIPFIKINTQNAYDDEIIKLFVKVGDRVEFDQVMLDIENPTTMLDDSDQEFVGLERFGVKQLKANMSGKVNFIEVLYNGEISSFHPETQKVIKRYDGERSQRASYRVDEAATGNVGGNTHVSKVDIYPGSVRINIYLEEILISTTSDKLVIANQMKCTIGYIYPIPIKTVDGRPVHLVFSVKSILARMVLSMRDKIFVNEMNNVYTHRLIERVEGSTNWKI